MCVQHLREQLSLIQATVFSHRSNTNTNKILEKLRGSWTIPGAGGQPLRTGICVAPLLSRLMHARLPLGVQERLCWERRSRSCQKRAQFEDTTYHLIRYVHVDFLLMFLQYYVHTYTHTHRGNAEGVVQYSGYSGKHLHPCGPTPKHCQSTEVCKCCSHDPMGDDNCLVQVPMATAPSHVNVASQFTKQVCVCVREYVMYPCCAHVSTQKLLANIQMREQSKILEQAFARQLSQVGQPATPEILEKALNAIMPVSPAPWP